MTSTAITLLALGTLLLAGLVASSCLALVIHHALSESLAARWERRTEEALLLLAVPIAEGEDLCEVAARAAKRCGHAPVAEVLRRACGSLGRERKAAVVAALEAIGEIGRLERRARSRSAARRRTAIRHLGECGGDRARAVLTAALQDPEWEGRRAARDGLLSDGREESIRLAVQSYVGEATRNLGWRRSFYARFALVAPEQLCQLLREARLDRDEEKLAIEALGHARSKSAIAEVRRRLAAEDPELRASAARFAGKLHDVASRPTLVRLLADREWFVRAAAARSLEGLADSLETLTALGRCLNDSSWWVRGNAARTLSRESEPGLAILRRAIAGDDAYARDAARAALAMLRVRPAAPVASIAGASQAEAPRRVAVATW